MNVVVNFLSASDAGRPAGSLLIGKVRIKEVFTATGTTVAGAAADEVILVTNNEAATVLVATGTTPDAAAAASTSSSSAGLAVPGNSQVAVVPSPGDKLNIKAA